MDPKFLDEVIVTLAKGGPDQRWLASMAGDPAEPIDREDRDAWAKRVAEDALALASARERVLLATQAVDADFGQDGDAAPPPRAEAMTVEEEAIDADFGQDGGGDGLEHEAATLSAESGDALDVDWIRVARAARVLHAHPAAPAVSEAMRTAIGAKFTNRAGDKAEGVALSWWNSSRPRHLEIGYESPEAAKAAQSAFATARDEIAALDSGASVVVDRAEWESVQKRLADRDRLWERSKTKDAEIRTILGVLPATPIAQSVQNLVEERDSLAAKVAEAERAVGAAKIECDRARESLVDEIGKREKAERERDTLKERIDGVKIALGCGEDIYDAARRMKRERDEARGRAEYWKAEHLAANAEIDALRTAPSAAQTCDVDALVTEYAGRMHGKSTVVLVTPSELRALIEKHLRPCPPATVYTVDVERAAERLCAGMHDSQANAPRVLAILRDCARAADVEGLAKAMQSAALIHSGLGAPSGDCPPSPDRIEDARAALAHLGLALAQEPRVTEPLFDIARPLVNAKWDFRSPFDVVLSYPDQDAATLARASAWTLHEHVRKLDAHTHQIVPVDAAQEPRDVLAEDAPCPVGDPSCKSHEACVPPGSYGERENRPPRDVLGSVDAESEAIEFAKKHWLCKTASDATRARVAREVKRHALNEGFGEDSAESAGNFAFGVYASIRSQLEARETRKEGA